jgi:hypothetical protein
LACKLIAQEFKDGEWGDAREINLDEEAVDAFRESLEEQRQVAQTGEEGTLVLIRHVGAQPGSEPDAGEMAHALIGLLQRPNG